MLFSRECADFSENEVSSQSWVKLVMGEIREIKLPTDLCAAAEEKFRGVFRSVDELLVCVLQGLIRGDTTDMDRADKAVVEARLRDLGYI